MASRLLGHATMWGKSFSGRGKTLRKRVALTLLALVLSFNIAGCSSSDEADKKVAGGDSTAATPGQDDSAEEADAGTQENPLPLGTLVEVGPWEVTVTEVNTDADDVIAAADASNKPPVSGSQFVLVGVSAKYLGGASGGFGTDMQYMFYGSKDLTFRNGGWTDTVAPDPITETAAVAVGESVSGNLVFEVRSDQVEGGTVMIERTTEDIRSFFAIEQ